MDYLHNYLDYIKKNKRLSVNTIKSYENDLKKYLSYLKSSNLELKNVSEQDIIEYSIKLNDSNKSLSTISRVISSIRSFHEYLFSSGVLFKNPSKQIKKPILNKKTTEILTEEEINSLLNFPSLDTPKLLRDKAIFEVLYGTGIKVSELIDLNIDDVNFDMDFIYCGKNKKRVIPLNRITKFYLKKYIDNSRSILVYDNETSLFVNSFGVRFSRQGLWKLIKSYAKNLNIDKNINPSILRNSFAIHLLNRGANIGVVSKILGNTNLSSLQYSLDYLTNNIRKEIKEKHPRSFYKGENNESNLVDN